MSTYFNIEKLKGLLYLYFLINTLNLTYAQTLELGLPVSNVGEIKTLDISPDNRMMASYGEDRMINIFDLETGKRIFGLGPNRSNVSVVKFSETSKWLSLFVGDQFKLLDIESQESIVELKGNVPVQFSKDDSRLLTYQWLKDTITLRLFNTKDWNVLRSTLIPMDVYSNGFKSSISPNGKFWLSYDEQDGTNLFETKNGEPYLQLEDANVGIVTSAFSKNKSFAYVTSNNELVIYDLDSKQQMFRQTTGQSQVYWISWNNDIQQLVTYSANNEIKVFDLNKRTYTYKITIPDKLKSEPRFSQNGSQMSIVTSNNELHLYDLNNFELKSRFQSNGNLSDTSTILNDKYVLLNSFDAGAKIIEATTQKVIFEYEDRLKELSGKKLFPVDLDHAVATSNDGNFFTFINENNNNFGLDNKIEVWDVQENKRLHTIRNQSTLPVTYWYKNESTFIRGGLVNKSHAFSLSNGALKETKNYKKNGIIDYYEFPELGREVVVAFDESGKKVELDIYDKKSAKSLLTISDLKQYKPAYQFKSGSKYIIYETSEKEFKIIDVETASSKDLPLLNTATFNAIEFNNDAQELVFSTNEGTLSVLELSTNTIRKEFHDLVDEDNMPLKFTRIISLKDTKFILEGSEGYRLLFDQEEESFKQISDLIIPKRISKQSPNKRYLIDLNKEIELVDLNQRKSIKIGGLSRRPEIADFSPDNKYLIFDEQNNIVVYDLENKAIVRRLKGQNQRLITLDFSHDNEHIISAAIDGSVMIHKVDNSEPLIQQFLFNNDPKKWVHLHHSGLFDASPEAMDLMYWVQGTEIIDFSQLKSRYWLPGLWEKVMKNETLPNVESLSSIKLQPKVKVGNIKNDEVSIHLTKRSGGYGPVALFLNGKEVSSDIRDDSFNPNLSEQILTYNLKDHPYLVQGENKIEVKASSENGLVQGRGSKGKLIVDETKAVKPNFYGVVIGIGEYANDDLDLKYTINDANTIASSLRLGASNLFGEDRSFIYKITSESDLRPDKPTIKNVFNQISKKANSDDIIMVYLSGHGISTSGDNGDFYYLTADAISAESSTYKDPEIRKSSAISTEEFVSWLKEIPTLKQVMIIDACGSGKAVDNLIATRNVDAAQIKAIDRMKDRTGMYIISGCAADAVSFEASKYGQGLLTYAILQGLRGAALRDDQFIDVVTIMNYARETVPDLAKGIGGIQTPQLLIPTSGSFDIGQLAEEDRKKIPLANPRKVFTRSTFVDQLEFEDLIGLSNKVDNALNQLSGRGAKSSFVFFDVANYPDACKLSGGYERTDNGITLTLRMRCQGEVANYVLEAENVDKLVEQILEKVESTKK